MTLWPRPDRPLQTRSGEESGSPTDNPPRHVSLISRSIARVLGISLLPAWGKSTEHPPRFSAGPQLLRKEVIQPHLPIRLPCYDFTPITSHTLDGYLLAVELPASSTTGFRDVTGGVYKARERIHRAVLMRDY